MTSGREFVVPGERVTAVDPDTIPDAPVDDGLAEAEASDEADGAEAAEATAEPEVVQ